MSGISTLSSIRQFLNTYSPNCRSERTWLKSMSLSFELSAKAFLPIAVSVDGSSRDCKEQLSNASSPIWATPQLLVYSNLKLTFSPCSVVSVTLVIVPLSSKTSSASLEQSAKALLPITIVPAGRSLATKTTFVRLSHSANASAPIVRTLACKYTSLTVLLILVEDGLV